MGKKLKVLHTMTWFCKGGGADLNVYHTINGLKDEFDMHIAVGDEIYQNHFENMEGITFHQCNDLVRPINLFKDLKAVYYFYKLIKKEKYDIVHTHESKASVVTRLAAKLAGTPVIIFGLHGVNFKMPFSKWKKKFFYYIEKTTIGAADKIIAVGQNVVDIYHEHNVGNKIPYEVVYSGIEVEKFKQGALLSKEERSRLRNEIGVSDTDFLLTNVGRLTRNKGQKYAIQAMEQLVQKFPNVKLLLAGEGELKEDYVKQVKEAGLENNIIFYGYCDNIPQLYGMSDLYFHTSLSEGLPRVVVESYLSKLPVVCFEVEGIHEIIDHGKTGYISKQYDVNTLVKYAAELISDDQKRETFGIKGCEFASERWDHHRMVDTLRDLYYKWLNEKTPGKVVYTKQLEAKPKTKKVYATKLN
ncbi:MAG: glycosyltransferase family 1 protein [Chitinophagaceae bacterium]|nr:MAG: glycosyltransferase family 1 protein [Chitinophagaceae bacterium]